MLNPIPQPPSYGIDQKALDRGGMITIAGLVITCLGWLAVGLLAPDREKIMELPGEQYQPSNGAEGTDFIEQWCANCQRDKAMREGCDFDECDDNELCEIIAASFRGEAVEWRELEGGECVCIAFVPAGEMVPERCPLTADMFGVPNA